MKKIHLIVQNKDLVGALETLRDLGVLHIEHQRMPEGGMIAHYKEDIRRIREALDILKRVDPGAKSSKSLAPARGKVGRMSDVKYLTDEIHRLNAEMQSLDEDMRDRQPLIDQWEAWGDFNPADVEYLKAAKVEIRLAVLENFKSVNIPPEAVLHSLGGDKYAVIFWGHVRLPFDVIDPPEFSLSELKHRQAIEHDKLAQVKDKLREHIVSEGLLEKTLADLESRLAFEETARSVHVDGEISVLKGFCPEENVDDIALKAHERRWGVSMVEPSREDHPPTLLRNPRWVNLIQPVMKIINVFPGYYENDISPVFLFFFTVFFGMLIGDAGYGIFFLAATLWARRKLDPSLIDRNAFYLLYVLCAATIVWGILTGTFFGQSWLKDWIHPVSPWLRDDNNVKHLCFMIAVAHLSVAHLWRAVLLWPSWTVLSELGWTMIVWSMYFLAGYFVLGLPLPGFFTPLISIAAVFIVFFTKPDWRIWRPVLSPDLIGMILSVISAFSDVVSYIRLFAVGLATVAVADAANQMSLFWIIILHTLNMILAAMAILVHGLRLNVLEFSGHMGLQWSGIPYMPFRNQKVSS